MSIPTILIVEDEAIISKDIANRLRRLGYAVVGATDTGEKAIEIARRLRPSLVLMDIRLAGAMDGVIAADTIRKECQLPVIFMTAHSDKATVQRAGQVQAFGYIMKPFDDRELHVQIEMALGKHAAELRLIESESRLREVLENSLDASYKRNLQTDSFDYLSPAITRISGYTPDEITDLSIETMNALIHPDDQAEVERVISGSMSGADGSAHHMEFRFRHKNGHYIWLHNQFTFKRDAGGKPSASIGIFRDITERKQAEDLLKDEISRRRILFENSRDGIVVLDQNGKVYEANKRYADMLGYSMEEIAQLHVWDWDTQFSREQIKEMIRSIDDAGAHFETRQRRKNGTIIDVELSNNGTEYKEHKLVFCICRDISGRKQLEAERARYEAQYRQLQKAESLNRMAAAIAHHFNNQLQAVMGNLEMAIDDQTQGSSTSDTLTEALEASRNAADVSRLMLTYLGQTPGKHELLDLSETCRIGLSMLRAVIPKNVIVELELPSSGPILQANTKQIQQLLSNLLTNAWESICDNQGVIGLTIKTVSGEDISTANRFPFDWQPRKTHYACMEIKDTGSGIADKEIEKLFDPFFTTKYIGRGMGLSVVLGIVGAHGGGVTVESEPDRGSVFRVFLPISTNEPLLKQDKTASTQKFPGSGTVLLVEDEAQVRKMVKKMLTRLGYHVLEAKDGIEAVEVFQQHQDEIRCVLSDLTMPRMNGWDTLTALRKLSPNIPVILSSGYDEAQVMTGEHPERPNAFLGKPYQLKGLRDTINRVLTNMS